MTNSKSKRKIVVGQTREEWETETIRESGLFDLEHYGQQAGLELALDEAVAHYVKTGERKGLSPSAEFDPAFYAASNPDIKDVGVGWFAHYIARGKGDGRYPNRAQVKADAIELSELTNGDREVSLQNVLYPRDPLAQQLKLDAIEAHLAFGWRGGDLLIDDFEDLLYYRLYGFDRDLHSPPLMHYLRSGRRAGYITNREQLAIECTGIEDGFDERYYEAQGRINEDVSALEEYCSIGWRRGRNPNAEFHTRYYLDLYADIRKGRISPFYHYMTSGKEEMRHPRPAYETMVMPGALRHDPQKETILVALHEASRTGAPLLGLEIGRHLSAKYNVVFVPSKGGELFDALTSHATYVVRPQLNVVQLRYLFEQFAETFSQPLLIANSVETVETAEAATSTSIPTVALLHEFAEYTFPIGKVSRMAMAADIVVTPAAMVATSAQAEIARVGQFRSNNIRVRVQGKLEELAAKSSPTLTADGIRELIGADKEGVKIVLGAGYVQGRKGVDIFVQTAVDTIRDYGDDVRFVWVGGGYKPEADIFTSVWLKAQIERLGLQQHVFFFPEQPDLEAFYEVSDLFYLSSRLDPFPNVAIDSIAKGKKIVCFEKASGVAEWIGDGRLDGAVVEYLSSVKAAEAICRLLREPSHSEKNLTAGKSAFSMQSYIDDILTFGSEARKTKTRILDDADQLLQKRLIDHGYFAAGAVMDEEDERRQAITYSTWSNKGLVVWNPRPGFNDGKYRAANRLIGRSVNPLLHSAERGQGLQTHACHVLAKLPERPHSLRVAAHIHLHYSDLANEFAARFAKVLPAGDLFLTVTSETARREVDYEFREHPGSVTVTVVPNRGRDIGPMMEILRRHHQDYDVFGHFHGKKSLFAGGQTGEVWRSFLLDTLAGSARDVDRIMALFEADTGLGLVFAEDRLSSGWTDNKQIAATMARELGLKVKPEDYPVYPVGTMFWARPAGLMPLIRSGLTTDQLPPEPLPDDATKLHALERLLPTMALSEGLNWCTVRKDHVNRRF